MAGATIRELSEPEEMKETVKTLKSAFTEIPDIEAIPDHIFTASAEHGILLGAYRGGEQVGFAMGMGEVGDGDRVYLHATGVRDDYQENSLGENLLREFARNAEDRGLNHVSLTYDPLLGGNAKLNIGKAGGTVDTYKENLYGAQQNEANAGRTPTDRFTVELDLTDEQVRSFLEGGRAERQFNNPYTVLKADDSQPDITKSAVEPINEDPLRYQLVEDPDDKYLGAEIPRDLSEVKKKGTERETRYVTRAVFKELMPEYEVISFKSGDSEEFENNTYILERK